MRDMLLVIPSRNRPASIARLIDTMDVTCEGQVDLVVGLDEDDAQLDDYLTRLDHPYQANVEYVVRPGLHQVVAWINELAMPRIGNYKYVGHMGDDNVPRTHGWDIAMMQALEETPFAFGNDLYPRAPGSLCCHVFARAEAVQGLGYFGPPGIRHMYVDVAWMAWGRATGITYRHDVILEHLHYTTGKSNYDSSYLTSTGLIPEDLQNWHAYSRSPQLNEDIKKIATACGVDGKEFTPESLNQFNVELNIPESLGHVLR